MGSDLGRLAAATPHRCNHSCYSVSLAIQPVLPQDIDTPFALTVRNRYGTKSIPVDVTGLNATRMRCPNTIVHYKQGGGNYRSHESVSQCNTGDDDGANHDLLRDHDGDRLRLGPLASAAQQQLRGILRQLLHRTQQTALQLPQLCTQPAIVAQISQGKGN